MKVGTNKSRRPSGSQDAPHLAQPGDVVIHVFHNIKGRHQIEFIVFAREEPQPRPASHCPGRVRDKTRARPVKHQLLRRRQTRESSIRFAPGAAANVEDCEPAGP